MDDAIAPLLSELPAPDESARQAVLDRAARVLRPTGALARLDEAAAWLAAWQRTVPQVDAPACLVFVADHGVVQEGVSAYPGEVTAGMLRALREGVATAAALSGRLGVRLEVVDVGVGRPTGNLRSEPALTPETWLEAFEAGRAGVAGISAVARVGCDVLVLGEMGIGNTTAASAVCATIFGGPAEQWTGRGTGLDDAGLVRKVRVVDEARRRAGDVGPIEALRQVGGAELVALAGAVVEARRRSIPVVLDGFVVTAAVGPIEMAFPGALAHCVAGHRSEEPGHGLLLEKLGMEPLLDLGLRLGEGTGGILAIPLLRAAVAGVVDVATFEEWGMQRS